MSCRTSGGVPNRAAPISMTVRTPDRTKTQESIGNVIFNYKVNTLNMLGLEFKLFWSENHQEHIL